MPNNNVKVNSQVAKQNALKTSNDTLTANTDSLKQTVSAVEAAPSMVNSTSNQIQNAKVIYHVIQKGDTLWNITNKYKMGSVDELMRINNLSKDYKLIPGGKIKVVVASN